MMASLLLFLQGKTLRLVMTISSKWRKEVLLNLEMLFFFLLLVVLVSVLVTMESRETTTGTCSLQHYIESILALQEASNKLASDGSEKDIPFAIMTSDDTHSRTLELLELNSYFGMKPSQVHLLKQEKVPCLDDNDARLALDPHNKYKIQLSSSSLAQLRELELLETERERGRKREDRDVRKTTKMEGEVDGSGV